MSINLIEEEVMSARPSTEQNRESLLRYFESRRVYRRALGQTVFPDPFTIQRDGMRAKAPEFTCGIPSGYDRHKKRGETPCDACRKARSDYDKAQRLKKALKERPCGTVGGYRRHKRWGETPCAPCAEARKNHVPPSRKPRPRKLIPCPSVAGYRRHLRDGETPCDGCRAANTAEGKKYYNRKKAKK